jgi:uncharacterized protein YjbI with pentapeptide repeats
LPSGWSGPQFASARWGTGDNMVVKPHQGDERRQHSFEEAWYRLAELGGAELTTSAGTAFSARATVTSRGARKGQRVIRYFQQGREYARCYECCWEHYYNCYGTRIGMYGTAADEWLGVRSSGHRLTREDLLGLIEQNGGPRALDLEGQDLSGLDLGRDAILEKLQARGGGEPLPAWAYTVKGEPRGIQLSGAHLRGAHLEGTILWGACLRGADLSGAYLREVNLARAELSRANLSEADLTLANVEGAWLMGADLRRAQLQGADCRHAELDAVRLQEARMWRARLGWSSLITARMQHVRAREVNLEGALLHGANMQHADLQRATLRGATLHDTDLEGADLTEADLRGVNLSVMNNLSGIWVFRSQLEKTNLTKEQLGGSIGEERAGRYFSAKEAYLALKSNFESIGRYDDASWAYVKERKMEKMTHYPRFARQFYAELEGLPHGSDWRALRWWWFYLRHTAKWVTDWLVALVCGYGESIVRVLGTLLLLWFLSALYYRLVCGVIGPDGASVTSFGDYLAYSLAALTTTGYDHLRPRLDLGWVPVVTAVEALLGIFLTGLLGFVAANRIRRS